MSGSSLFGRLTSVLAGLVGGLAGLSGAGVAATQPQSVAPSEAPAEWLRYAEAATMAVTGWLEEESEAAARFRAYFAQTQVPENEATPTLELKVWVDRKGVVSRIDFVPFAHAQANDDLRAAITGRRMPSAPPRDMLLPLRIAVEIKPAPAADVPDVVSEPGSAARRRT